MIRRRQLVLAGIALATVACSSPAPSSPAGSPLVSDTPTPSIAASGVIGDPGGGLGLDPPGRPFDAGDILAAMRDSRRPGGVAAELQTDEVAAAVADAVWTLQGDPWESIAASGSCESNGCTLELAGSTANAADEDVWVLAVDPADAAVEVVTADLHGVPDAAVDGLDRMARGAPGGEALDGLLLTSVRWQPPPDASRFVLAYRSGDEEGSCALDVELDIESVTVTEVASDGC